MHLYNMLGKRSCIHRTTSSKSLLIPGNNSCGESPTFCEFAEVMENGPSPALCSPRKIVIGFDVGAEKKPLFDVCESPRSVLDSSDVLSTQGKQKVVARSPCSGLGSLLAAKNGSEENVSLGIHSSNGKVNLPPTSVVDSGQCKSQCRIQAPGLPLPQGPSKVNPWLNKVSGSGPMDSDISACHGQARKLQADMGDEILDADISPIRVGGTCVYQTEEMTVTHGGITTPMASVNKIAGTAAAVQCLAPHKEGRISGPGHTQPNTSLHLWQAFCNKGYANTCQEQCWHGTNLDVEEVGTHHSIFCASSPPLCPQSVTRDSPGFLKMCNLCGRSLLLGKDIFMYRGDEPFCSAECRYKKIVIDERKDKRGS